jgi:hypothetical protein
MLHTVLRKGRRHKNVERRSLLEVAADLVQECFAGACRMRLSSVRQSWRADPVPSRFARRLFVSVCGSRRRAGDGRRQSLIPQRDTKVLIGGGDANLSARAAQL